MTSENVPFFSSTKVVISFEPAILFLKYFSIPAPFLSMLQRFRYENTFSRDEKFYLKFSDEKKGTFMLVIFSK